MFESLYIHFNDKDERGRQTLQIGVKFFLNFYTHQLNR
ncbi:hypothetical protein BN8_02181 [Fibrisoma limi BUZ 3]|uniref:Uncharacterized protein n=1 Tax=Fibrisoma limi BUZ 3 TaxID=1185876 RepID=I2GGT9_9BACT|nr:hypothetical protein BN8_02181 [Fibrisoma limi BUZ 3]